MSRWTPQSTLRILVALATALAPLKASAGSVGAVDVALHEGGLLIGQYVTGNGEPKVGEPIRITLTDGRTTVAKTDEHGAFAFRGATGAVTLSAADAKQLARVWSPTTAPPNSTQGVLLVEQDEVARGQRHAAPGTNRFFKNGKNVLANPIVIAGIAAAAIAIPVSLANDDDPASP